MNPTADAFSATLPFYEASLREGLSAWWSTAASTPSLDGSRVSKRLLLPAMGLGALAAVSIYHRLGRLGVGPVVVPDQLDATDPLRHHNVVNRRPALISTCLRLTSILFAIHGAKDNPTMLRAMATGLHITPRNTGMLQPRIEFSHLCSEVLTRIFNEMPATSVMTQADYALLEARINRVGFDVHQAIEQASQPTLPQTL